MARSLDVYLHDQLAGALEQDDHGQIQFQYAESWRQNPQAIPLSQSLSLHRTDPFNRNECLGFFGGVLPEANQRDVIAQNLGISARNDFALLEQIGGECAGAVSFVPKGATLPESDGRYRFLTPPDLADTLRRLPRRPLLAGEDGIRLSLAGAHAKLAVYVLDSQIALPLDGSPSTHILKPNLTQIEGLTYNEAFCMALARMVNLRVAPSALIQTQEIDYLLIERYDRVTLPSRGRVGRLHQEDFCQALGIASENKYQSEGGPSLQQCFHLVREVSTAPVVDLIALLDGVIFNFLIGNNDAHGKNFSLVYVGGGQNLQTRLAPLYDLICTIHYPELSKKMAMKLGGEYDLSQVWPRHFERLAEETGFAKAMVGKRVTAMASEIIRVLPTLQSTHPLAVGIADTVRARCIHTLERFARVP